MPKMVLKWKVADAHADELAGIFMKTGGRGGMARTAQLLGVHRDTLVRGIRNRQFGPKAGQKIIDGLKGEHPDIDTKFLTFKCE